MWLGQSNPSEDYKNLKNPIRAGPNKVRVTGITATGLLRMRDSKAGVKNTAKF
jgi:hypothetical protein